MLQVDIINKFFELFAGSTSGHGEYICQSIDPDSNKMDGVARTIKGGITLDLWRKHLEGKIGLGVIPIDTDNHCVWGAIDIDDYHGFDHRALVKKVAKLKLPLVVCRSKSGGAHVFLFTSQSVPAEKMREVLRKLAARLGHGGQTEIFPKQSKVLHERGDLGNWLNMPYQDAANVTVRYGLDFKTCRAISDPGKFLDLCFSRRITFEELCGITLSNKKIKVRGGNPFSDGFPCLEIMHDTGIAEGGRNNAIFQLGVQLRIKYPGDWENHFDKLSMKMLKNNPLPPAELMTIKKSVDRKEYGPKCEQEPMSSHCDKATCRNRKFGIGTNANYALVENIVKIPTDPVIWFADVNGERTEFESEDLLNQRKFRKVVLEAHNIFPPIMKDGQWAKTMSSLLANCDTHMAYSGTSRDDMFYDLLTEFCTRKQAKSKSELVRGIPWADGDYVYFKMLNFNAYLTRSKYVHYTMPQRCQRIKNVGGGSKYMNVKGKEINLWYVPFAWLNDGKKLGPEPINELPRAYKNGVL